MSFSLEVKTELMQRFGRSENVRKAELAALIMLDSRNLTVNRETGVYEYRNPKIGIKEENGFTLQRKTFTIKKGLGNIKNIREITKKADEKRAFLRGAFLASGTVANPDKEYHLEIILPDEETAGLVKDMTAYFDIKAKITRRKEKKAVYVKDSEDISSMLNVIEAHKAMMEFENSRIEHELNGSVNRKINCDTANINKSVTAAAKQIGDIELVSKYIGLENLDEGLAAVCTARLENPDASLQDLSEIITPTVSKSGVNHRLRKIAGMADSLRSKGRA